MASATVVKTFAADVTVYNGAISPFQAGNHIAGFSVGTPTIYGANRPANSDATKYAVFKQTVTGNKLFELPSGSSPITTISTATQLRVVGIVNGVVKKRGSGAATPAAGSFVVAAGGGTAVADATLSIKGTTAAALLVGSTQMSIASSGADTQTILVGDQITVDGDSQVYTATATTATLNGTTEVLVSITPPLQVAKVAAQAVTVTAATGKSAIFAEAPAVGLTVEVWILASTDIVTVGTLVASTPADLVAYDAMVATAAATISPLAKA